MVISHTQLKGDFDFGISFENYLMVKKGFEAK